MIPRFTTTCSRLLPLFAVAALACGAWAQSAERIEVQEAQAALSLAQSKIEALEAKLSRAKEQNGSLGERLVTATDEARQARESYDKLRLQLEGLGVAALSGNNAQGELQQRLLSALSDMRILDQQRRQLIEALMNLSEAALSYAKAAPNAGEEHQQALNKSLSSAEKALAGAQNDRTQATGAEGNLQSAKIISVKDELGIAVLNVGSRQGVHPGMPITIYRQDKPIARAMVADVRSSISGVIVQDMVNEKDTVKVGDIGRVETSKS